MAAIGSFGRRPRNSGGNLTSLIAELYRQQQAAKDRNIFDAWQNGGEFEGKPVTDKRIIAYIKGRRNTFDKSDPDWDQWNDTLVQTRFSIGEQEITLKFNQGKVGAGAVAAFYRNQLDNIPRHSQFYRTIAGRAAQWAKSAAGAARGAARSRARAALNANLARAARAQATFDGVTAAIEEAAHRAGLIFGSRATFADADAGALIDLVNHLGMKVNGHPVTYEYWQELGRRKAASLDRQIALKDQAGYTTKTLRSQRRSFIAGELGSLNALDDRSQYEALHQGFEDDIHSAQSDPMREIEIGKEYLASLQSLAKKATQGGKLTQDTPDFIGALNNEITSLKTGVVAGPNAYDLFENRTSGEATTRTSDMESTVALLFGDPETGEPGSVQRAQGIANGTMYYGQSEYGKPLDVHPVDPAGLDISQTVAVVNIDGQAKQVVLAGQEINAATYKHADGSPVDPASLSDQELRAGLLNGSLVKDNNVPVGYVYDNPASPGQRFYGAYDATGQLHFTTDNPFASALASPDGTLIAGTNADGTFNLGSVVNAETLANSSPVAIDQNASSRDLLNLGDNLLKQGNPAGQALVDAGVAKQPTTHLQQLLAANVSPDEYGTPLSQSESLAASEARDRLLANSPYSLGNQQTFLTNIPGQGGSLTRAGSGAPGGANYQNLLTNPIVPPQAPINPKPPSAPQPAIKPPPTITVPAPPPVVTITPEGEAGSAIGFKTGSQPKQKAPKPPKITYQNNGGPSQSKGFY